MATGAAVHLPGHCQFLEITLTSCQDEFGTEKKRKGRGQVAKWSLSGLRLLNPPCLPPRLLSSLSPATGDNIKGGISLGGRLTLGSGFRNRSPMVSRYLSHFLAKGDGAVCPTPFLPATHSIFSAVTTSVCNLRHLTFSAGLQLQGLGTVFGHPLPCMLERLAASLPLQKPAPYLWADMCSWQ